MRGCVNTGDYCGGTQMLNQEVKSNKEKTQELATHVETLVKGLKARLDETKGKYTTAELEQLGERVETVLKSVSLNYACTDEY
jgi:hypothetical protein